ncbi:hypothetical protein ACFLV1_02595 [Chloroflexota bacterium]
MPKKRALMLVKIDPPPEKEREWNDWYNGKHAPDRLKVPGFLFARRFVNLSDKAGIFTKGEPKYLTLYDLTSAEVLKSEAFLNLREREKILPQDSFEVFTNNHPHLSWGAYEQAYPEDDNYQPPSSQYLLLAEHELPRQYEEEYHAFYNTEHIPAITKVPGFLTARRFVLTEKFPTLPDRKSIRRYLTIFDIAKGDFFTTPEFERYRTSPWTSRMQSKFTQRLLLLYERIWP